MGLTSIDQLPDYFTTHTDWLDKALEIVQAFQEQYSHMYIQVAITEILGGFEVTCKTSDNPQKSIMES